MDNIENYINESELVEIVHKYNTEERITHEKRVTQLALTIFDNIKNGYSLEERNLLKYGAMLHHIGYFIDEKNHYKYSKKIIINDQIFDVLPEDLRCMLAMICRSHRKSIDKEIDCLPIDDRKMVIKLIEILRTADE